jgi:3-carboxy-cis,cis-muconate cycloisomerase
MASADVGLVDAAVAEEIAHVCATIDVDADRVLRETWEQGTPVLPLLAAVRAALSPAAVEVIGFGATTQDIVDTAMQVQIRNALACIEPDLDRLAGALAAIATHHRRTPMIGRTFLQHARPTSFGLRAAQWLDPVAEHRASVQAAMSQCAVQLGGPVGTLEDVGADVGLSARLGERLDLRDPVASWHGDRSRVTRVVALVGQIAATMAKIATDLALLSSSEIGEVRVRGGGSSTMAGKHNPIDSVRALAAAQACLGAVNTVMAARPVELERGIGGWHVEWFAVPIAFMTGAATVEAMVRCTESLGVDVEAMQRNLGAVDPTGAVDNAAVLVDRILARHGYGR